MSKNIIRATVVIASLLGSNVSYADDPFISIGTNPVSLMLTDWNAEIGLMFFSKVGIIGGYDKWNFKFSKLKYDQTGYEVRLIYFLDESIKDGNFVGVFADLYDAKIEMEDRNLIGTQNVSSNVYGALIGHWWFFNNFNFRFSAGYGFGAASDPTVRFSDGTTKKPDYYLPITGGMNIDMRVGIAF